MVELKEILMPAQSPSHNNQTQEDRLSLARFSAFVFTGIASVLLFFNFLFILTLYQMGERLSVLVQPLTFTRDSDSVVIADDLNKNVASLDLINEAMVRHYIETRYTTIPDYRAMVYRWGGEMALMSSDSVYRNFLGRDAEQKIEQAAKSSPTVVHIKDVQKAGANWAVEFDLLSDNGQVGTYVASLKTQNNMSRCFFGDGFINPIGTVVVEYKAFPKKND